MAKPSSIPWRERLALRPDEVAAVLGVSRAAVYAAIKTGAILTEDCAGAKRVPVYWLLAKESEWQQPKGGE